MKQPSILRSAPLPVKLKKRGRFLAAIPDHPISQLTSETIEWTRRQLTREPGFFLERE
ncbi:MAG: hypothetical protein JSS39_19800 [Nitrospira sp.]|nr:hypothetical protein [Nitrospira sp.]